MTSTAITPPNSINPMLTGEIKAAAPDKVKAAAKDFEAVFISEMLNNMFSGLETDPMFGGGAGEDMFRSMLVGEYGKKMAQGNGIGISDQLQKMMLQMQQG